MLVLALDTTSRAGNIAVARDGVALGCHVGLAGLTHAQRLPADLLVELDRHGLSLGDVDVFAVAAGPGSFTGLRIGMATIQGLAFACNRRVVAISALDALARLGASPGEDVLVGAWIDALRGEVYSALYRCAPTPGDSGPEPALLDPPAVGSPEQILDWWREQRLDRSVRFIGGGALKYRHLLAQSGFACLDVEDLAPPLAPAIAQIATRTAALGGAVAPHAVRPLYVRRPDAELARDRRAGEG